VIDGDSPRKPTSCASIRCIATMDQKAPLPPLRNQKPTWTKAASLARDWQLNKLAERLDALAASRS
jgi:DNA polymerase I